MGTVPGLGEVRSFCHLLICAIDGTFGTGQLSECLDSGFVPDFRVTFTSSGLSCILENFFASGGEGETV
jgi:hypothetical protein